MLGTGLKEQRRSDARDLILAAAWEAVREEGLAGLTMRDLAARVGIKAPSLYSYFASKLDIYDAMFRQAYRELETRMSPYLEAEIDLTRFREGSHTFFEFCTEDPERYQLLFHRTLPGFEPSAASYALAQAFLARLESALARLGATEPADVDLWTAISSGLTSQQIANDPGGDRWRRLVDDAIDMYFDRIERTRPKKEEG